ncbi:MAG TPA: hypothetical protein VFX33_00555 [Actinomycetales bacterium]|jgi:hypothetical protein|nr:hypothetical protein [Actinomycetales bacterium]
MQRVSVAHLSELRLVLDWYDDLPPDGFSDPLTLAILVEEFAMAARAVLDRP